jgi:hypothetical protein
MSKENKKRKSHVLRDILIGVVAVSILLFILFRILMPLFS